MDHYIPNMYQKSILDINYDKLKKNKIQCLIFDLDNTIALIDEKKIPNSVLSLFEKLKKDFQLVIISNNTKKRIAPFCNPYGIPFVSFSMKPFSFGFRKVKKMFHYKNEEMCMIGDQIMTDILGGNRFGIFTILVDPLGKKDLKITSLNRFFESRKIKKMASRNLFEKGRYYE